MTIHAAKSWAEKTPAAAGKSSPGLASAGVASPKQPLPAAGSSPAKEAQRRKLQRVLLRIRAKIHVTREGKAQTHEVRTVSVYSHGALVVMAQGLPTGTRLVIEHSSTGEVMSCSVAHPPRETPEGFHVALAFDSSAPDFWKIDFPPEDWRPDDL